MRRSLPLRPSVLSLLVFAWLALTPAAPAAAEPTGPIVRQIHVVALGHPRPHPQPASVLGSLRRILTILRGADGTNIDPSGKPK